MKKSLLFALIISAPSFAGTLILSKIVTSGYIQPEFSFKKECIIFREGYAKIIQRIGQNPPASKQISVRFDKTFFIQTLNVVAKKGKLRDEGTRCDAGNMILDGYVRGVKVILDEDKDCESHIINQSRATPQLQRLATNICGF